MADTCRILVTGSREWEDGRRVYEEVIHGACPRGADRFADLWAGAMDTGVVRYPADWTRFGKSAGFRRNAEMVALGASLCLAFIAECRDPKCRRQPPGRHGSHGATHCADLAESAGIPVRRFTDG